MGATKRSHATTEDIKTTRVNMVTVRSALAMIGSCAYASQALSSLRNYSTGSTFTLSLLGVITEDTRLKHAAEALETQIERAVEWSLIAGFIPFRRKPPPSDDESEVSSSEEEEAVRERSANIFTNMDLDREGPDRTISGSGGVTYADDRAGEEYADDHIDDTVSRVYAQNRIPYYTRYMHENELDSSDEGDTLKKIRDIARYMFVTEELLFEVPSVGIGEYSTYVDPDTMVRKVRCDGMNDSGYGQSGDDDQADPHNKYRWHVYVVEPPMEDGTPTSPAVRVLPQYQNYMWITEMERAAVRLGVDPIVVAQRENTANARRSQDNHTNVASDYEMLHNHVEEVDQTGIDANLVEELRTARENFYTVAEQLERMHYQRGVTHGGDDMYSGDNVEDARQHYIKRGYQYSNQIKPTHVVSSRDALEPYRAALSTSFGIPSRDLGSVSNRFKEDRDSQLPPLMAKARKQRDVIANFVQVVLANIVPKEPIDRLVNILIEQFTEMKRAAWLVGVTDAIRRGAGLTHGNGRQQNDSSHQSERMAETLQRALVYIQDSSVKSRPFKLTWDTPLYVSRSDLDDLAEQLDMDPEKRKAIARKYYGVS